MNHRKAVAQVLRDVWGTNARSITPEQLGTLRAAGINYLEDDTTTLLDSVLRYLRVEYLWYRDDMAARKSRIDAITREILAEG